MNDKAPSPPQSSRRRSSAAAGTARTPRVRTPLQKLSGRDESVPPSAEPPADETGETPPPHPPVDTPAPAPAAARRRRGRRTAVITTVAAVVVGALAALVAGVAVDSAAPTYRSQALLTIDQPGAIAASPNDGVIAKLSRLRTKYTGLVRTEVFAQPVADRTGLSVGTLIGATSAAADPSSLLVLLRAQAHDPSLAQTIARAMSEHLVDYVDQEQVANHIPRAERVSFTVVTPAQSAAKISPSRQRVYLIAGGAFIIAAGLVFAAIYVGRRPS